MDSNGSPIEYPKLELNGQSYEAKITLGTLLRLEDAKIVLTDIVALDVRTACEIGARIFGRYEDGQWKPIAESAQELADMIPLGQMQSFVEAMSAAFAKAVPPKTTEATPAALPPQ